MKIEKYRRNFALYDDNKSLIAVCVYKKGAKQVKETIEHYKTLAEQAGEA